MNGIPDTCDLASGAADTNGNSIPDECEGTFFLRGDANADGAIDISDPILVIVALFGGDVPTCLAAADANADDMVDLGDAIALLNLVFAGGAPPPAPYPVCGPDPDTLLGCDSYASCP